MSCFFFSLRSFVSEQNTSSSSSSLPQFNSTALQKYSNYTKHELLLLLSSLFVLFTVSFHSHTRNNFQIRFTAAARPSKTECTFGTTRPPYREMIRKKPQLILCLWRCGHKYISLSLSEYYSPLSV